MKIQLQPPVVPGRNTPGERQALLQQGQARAEALRDRVETTAARAKRQDEGPNDYAEGNKGQVRLDNAELSFDPVSHHVDHFHFDNGTEIQRLEHHGDKTVYTLKNRFHFAPLNDPMSSSLRIELKGSSHVDFVQRAEFDAKSGAVSYSEANLLGDRDSDQQLADRYAHPAQPGSGQAFRDQNTFITDHDRPWKAAAQVASSVAWASVPAWTGVLSHALGNPLPAVLGTLAVSTVASVLDARNKDVIGGGASLGKFIAPAIVAGAGAVSPALAGVATLAGLGYGCLGASQVMHEWE